MSLGPPFDASGLRLQQRVGAVVVLLVGGAVAWVLAFSGRTLGRGLTFTVEMASTGPLRAGDKVRIAGREVGEIRNARARHASVESPFRSVEFDVFIQRAWAAEVRTNSQLFVATPSVLGEAYLEIGPPAHGEEPGPPITEGARLRGADPPDIDRFFQHAEASIREVLSLLDENKPELTALLSAGDELLATLSGLPADRGQLSRIVDQGAAALEEGRALVAVAREAGGIGRVRAMGHELSAIAGRAGPELRQLAQRVDRAIERVDQLSGLFSDERRAQVETALTNFRRLIAFGERIAADARFLEHKLELGEGTVGGFLADKEIFDDLHETHRIIKSQPLRFLLKTVKPKEHIFQ